MQIACMGMSIVYGPLFVSVAEKFGAAKSKACPTHPPAHLPTLTPIHPPRHAFSPLVHPSQYPSSPTMQTPAQTSSNPQPRPPTPFSFRTPFHILNASLHHCPRPVPRPLLPPRASPTTLPSPAAHRHPSALTHAFTHPAPQPTHTPHQPRTNLRGGSSAHAAGLMVLQC